MDLRPPSLPDRLWQLGYRLAFPVMRLGWRIWPRPHQGALVAISVGDAVLLVRSSYRAQWSFPGGGVEAGEAPADAAQRELREELGISLAIKGEPVVVKGGWEGRPDTVFVFRVALGAMPPIRVDNREVTGARLVQRSNLPHHALSGPVRDYLACLASAAEDEHPRP